MQDQKGKKSGASDRKQAAPVPARQSHKPGLRSGSSTRKVVAVTAVIRKEKKDG